MAGLLVGLLVGRLVGLLVGVLVCLFVGGWVRNPLRPQQDNAMPKVADAAIVEALGARKRRKAEAKGLSLKNQEG